MRIFTEADCWILPIGMQNRGDVAGHGRANVRLENTRDLHMKPEVSIIVPAFNASELLPKALKSLADQTLQELEVIIVDDGSTDDTVRLAEDFAARDDRFKVVRMEENGGGFKARSNGIKHAIAPWIGFLDADDFAHRTMFERLHARCKKDQSDIAICGTRMVDRSGRMLGVKVGFRRDRVVTDELFEKFCKRDFGSAFLWNKLYRTDLLHRFGTANPISTPVIGQDTIVNFGCFLEARRVSLISDVLHDYLIHPKSITQSGNDRLSFCRLFRAFAIAVDLYQNRGEEKLHWIAHLYRMQLAFYPVDDISSLQDHADELGEAVELLAREYPIGLAMLASTGSNQGGPYRFRKAAEDWVKLTGQTTDLFFKALMRTFHRQ